MVHVCSFSLEGLMSGQQLKETFLRLLLCLRKKEGGQLLLHLAVVFPEVGHPATAGARTGLPGAGFGLMYTWSAEICRVLAMFKAKLIPWTPRCPPKWGSGLHQMCHLQLPRQTGTSLSRKGTFTELSGFYHHRVKTGCLLLRRPSLASGFQLQMKQKAECLQRNPLAQSWVWALGSRLTLMV